MANKRVKLYVGVVSAVLCLFLCGWMVRAAALKKEFSLLGEWYTAIDRGNDKEARRLAVEIGYFDETLGAVCLAHLAVLDSTQKRGDISTMELTESLKRLKTSWFGINFDLNERPIYMLHATISAMLGDRESALRFATRSCGSKDIDACLNNSYYDGRMFAGRFTALRNLEVATLELAIVNESKSKTDAIFRKASALRFFNITKAHKLISHLRSSGNFSPDMEQYYCDPIFPPDQDVCSKRH